MLFKIVLVALYVAAVGTAAVLPRSFTKPVAANCIPRCTDASKRDELDGDLYNYQTKAKRDELDGNLYKY